MLKRGKLITAHVTEEKKEEMRRRAEALGMSAASLVRAMLLQIDEATVQPTDEPKRNKVLAINLTEAQREEIRRMASESGMTMTDFVLSTVLPASKSQRTRVSGSQIDLLVSDDELARIKGKAERRGMDLPSFIRSVVMMPDNSVTI